MEKLSNINVLFVEDEELAREKLGSVLKKIFNNADYSENGKTALEKFEKALSSDTPYDLIISDINMPIMDGLELAKNIRNNGHDIPIIFTTARNETEYLLKAIDLNITHYLIKPINIDQLVEKSKLVCEKIIAKRALETKEIEMQNLLSTLDSFAEVAIFDKDGNLTYVNDIYCNLSKYFENELLGKNIKELISQESNKISFQTLWEKINQGEKWQGTIKKYTKDNEEYFVNKFIMPIFNENNGEIKEFISISYITTQDELKKRHLTKKLFAALQQFKQKELENRKELDKLKSQAAENSVKSEDTQKINALVKKISVLQNQILHTEREIKRTRNDNYNIVSKANTKVTKVLELNTSLKKEKDYFKKKYAEIMRFVEKRQEKINELEIRIKEKNKQIEFLHDVIKSNESKIKDLTEQIEETKQK